MSAAPESAASGLLEHALTYHRANDLAAAEHCYRAILADYPFDVNAVSYLALLYIQQDRGDAALSLLRSALDKKPDTVRWLANLGQFEQQLGNLAAAEQALRTALHYEPGLLDARLRLGQIIMAQLGPLTPYPAQKISVLMPSRLDRHPVNQRYWLEQAIETVANQTVAATIPLEIIIGVDHGMQVPDLPSPVPLRFMQAAADAPRNQAAALNAAARGATGDVLAFMEDDDFWDPHRLEYGLRYLNNFDFISSNQLEITPTHELVRLNDYATPSGWLMTRALWDRIGQMDDAFKWHLDGEWLGRLNASGAKRCHLTDNNVPQTLAGIKEQREYLLSILHTAPIGSIIIPTDLPHPLVYRTVHINSGMATIEHDSVAHAASKEEDTRIIAKYGHLPC